MFSFSQKTAVFALLIMNVCGSISLDIHLPAIPSIQCEFGCSTFAVQMIFIISIALLGIAPLLWGHCSDNFERKTLFIVAAILTTVGQFLCALSTSIGFMIVSRIIQYFGVSGVAAITIAIICDLYQGKERARMLALREMSLPFGLVIAPILGGYIVNQWGWRYNFWILGILQTCLIAGSIHFFIQKTKQNLPHNVCKQSSLKNNILQVFANKNFIVYALLLACTNAVYMIFIMHSSFLYLKHWQVSNVFFVVTHSIFAVLYFLSLFLFRIFVQYKSVSTLINYGMFIFCFFGILTFLYYLNIVTQNSLNLIVIMYISCIASGFIIAGCTTLAMQSSQKATYGIYAACLGMIESITATIFMALSGLYTKNLHASMMVFILLSIIFTVLIWQKTIKSNKYTL